MSNRTDFGTLVQELAQEFSLPESACERIETELHNAHVAGQEGSPCGCRWCTKPQPQPQPQTHTCDPVTGQGEEQCSLCIIAGKRHRLLYLSCPG